MNKKSILKIHRWVSVGFAGFWLVQALTGLFAVYHWEIDDMSVSGAHQPTDFAKIDAAIAQLAPPQSEVQPNSMWTSAGAPDRFDLYVYDSAASQSITYRIDGAGKVLRTRNQTDTFANGAIVGLLISVHHNFLAGDLGKWIVGISGVLLLSNLILGVVMAWPKKGAWRRTLQPKSVPVPAARYFSWHRAVGLWVAFPAIFIVATGILMVYHGELSGALNVKPTVINAPEKSTLNPEINLAYVTDAAFARYPGAIISGVTFPTQDRSYWTLAVNQPAELARAYGKTRLHLSAADGAIVGEHNTLTTSSTQKFLDSLFSLHVGEAGGEAGRILSIIIGIWLIAMIVLGALLWFSRRKKQPRASA